MVMVGLKRKLMGKEKGLPQVPVKEVPKLRGAKGRASKVSRVTLIDYPMLVAYIHTYTHIYNYFDNCIFIIGYTKSTLKWKGSKTYLCQGPVMITILFQN